MINLMITIILISSPLLITILLSLSTHAAQFDITNHCPYTVWPAILPGGGGVELKTGLTLSFSVDPGDAGSQARIWGRTTGSGSGSDGLKCSTGDCDGRLHCTTGGTPPVTLAEYTVQGTNLDFFDISLVDGFNLPMEFSPIPNSKGCMSRGIICKGDVVGQCPGPLRGPGVYHSACSVFQTDEYCCSGSFSTSTNCTATKYSRYFKSMCPHAYSYAYDDATNTFTCPTGTSYNIKFCPGSNITDA